MLHRYNKGCFLPFVTSTEVADICPLIVMEFFVQIKQAFIFAEPDLDYIKYSDGVTLWFPNTEKRVCVSIGVCVCK